MPALIVQKFGGTSVASPEVIKTTAQHVWHAYQKGHKIVVVVSAMAGVTDQLIEHVRQVAIAPHAREYDVVVSAGEQVTCGLMALVLRNMGLPAQSWLGWQIPIVTDSNHSHGHIKTLDHQRLNQALAEGIIPVVAGFQGITDQQAITTLGRGGSDLTAVAIAANLHAERCDLYKDVNGIYTADPKIVSNARQLNHITYEEMLELASLGSKVLQCRAVKMAITHQVRLRIVPTFGKSDGTMIINAQDVMEKSLIRSIVCNREIALITIDGIQNFSETTATLFRSLSVTHIQIDMINHYAQANVPAGNNLSFTVAKSEDDQVIALLNQQRTQINCQNITKNSKVAKISIVGVGLQNSAQFASTLFETLHTRNIPLHGIATSEIKMSILVDEEYAELATRALHNAFELDQGKNS